MSCSSVVSSIVSYVNPKIRLIHYDEGTTMILRGRAKIMAVDLLFSPSYVICHQQCFSLVDEFPVLDPGDYLVAPHTYFIIHLDRLECGPPPLRYDRSPQLVRVIQPSVT